MADFLMVAAGLILLLGIIALGRALRRPAVADRMMAPLLLCTSGIAVLMLLSAATGGTAALDVALVLALLAGFASVAFILAARRLGEK